MKRIEKVKEFAKRHADKAALTAAMVLASAPSAFASEASGLGGVTTAIEGAAKSVKDEAPKVIAAMMSVGVVFWGAKKLWGFFKGR